MKYFITIIFLFLIQLAFCQEQTDTLIPKSEIENLKWKIYELKQANKKLEYDNYLLLNFYKTDTILKRKDSVVINFITKDGKVLKQETNKYDFGWSAGQKTDSSIAYYNKKGLPEYIEGWECSITVYEVPEKGVIQLKDYFPRGLKFSFQMEYDKMGNNILQVFKFPNIISILKMYYDNNGNVLKSISERIKKYEFLDN